VHKTSSIDQMHFTQTPIDYKSIDLEYTSQQKDYKEKRPQKKSVKEKVGYDHWVNISNWLQGSLMKKASIETKDFKKMKVSLS